MLSKIQKKLLGIKCTIDIIEYEGEILTVKGWIFSLKKKIEDLYLIIDDGNKKQKVSISKGIKRTDVYQNFHNEYAKKCGLYGQAILENMGPFSVWLAFKIKNRTYRLKIGVFSEEKRENFKLPPRIREIESGENGIDLTKLIKAQSDYRFIFPDELYESSFIDIIVPIYNGYNFLETLLETITYTRMKYRLILIDDKSPDERVYPYLKEYADDKENVLLLQNEHNVGFVRTVNRGFELADNHIALVNSDVVLPDMWLERLMFPILRQDTVASSTPYTNCGTICSFPEMGKDNDLFLNLNIENIDSEFLKIPPRYEEMPTGVGFCMGINYNLLQKVGLFDSENFGMGYGEENDWCQRAIEEGYKNVHVENLFVYHKHGGSFVNEDKKKYLEQHEKVLLKKHPYYNKDVARFFTLDPNREIREFVKLNLIKNIQNYYGILAFDHSLGGGASKYLIERCKENIESGNAFVIVKFNFIKECFALSFNYKKYKIRFYIKNIKNLFDVMAYIGIKEIWINEMVTYPDLYATMSAIKDYSKVNKAKVKMLVHDFFCVCPTINLLGKEGKYCKLPHTEVCNACLKENKSLQNLEYETITKWRDEWKNLFDICEEVVVFSNNSKDIIENAFGTLDNIIVKPHRISYIPKLEKKYKTTKTLNIGLLGILTKHKGRTLIREIIKKIETDKLDITITLIGSSTKKIESNVFKETGKYTRDSIPRLILENDIDIFLIPSIWPETFSYTTEEVMNIGMPVMCFDIGAPAERVSKYEKGIIIPEISAEAVINTVKQERIVRDCMKKNFKDGKVLFVVEEETFSSRYRVEHLREQLLQQGIDSDYVQISKVLECNLSKYKSVVIYRCSKEKSVLKLIDKAHKHHKNVYYDMDDYIFEYDKIKTLEFLQGEDYVDFEQYSEEINRTMALCDGYIVSTANLKKAVEKCFPQKPVVINRNVASMEMQAISLGIDKKSNPDKVVLGYFSGSKTHDADFKQIQEQILYILENNAQVYLHVGGQIELSKEFDVYKNRIKRTGFVSWKELPYLIACTDINLMPLEDTFFHACKSENKWMESAFVQVPTVATWNNELELVIDNEVTGYLCKDAESWKSILQRLVDDSDLRKNIAEAANRKVLNEYTTFHMEQEVLELLLH